MRTVDKSRPGAPPGFFEAEAAGLAWLAEAESQGGARIARVISVGPGRISLARVDTVGATADHAAAFGAALACTHAAGARAFGAPPDGWEGPLFIGRRRQPASAEAAWGAFFARDRIMPFVPPAVDRGHLAPSDAAVIEKACALVAGGVFDDGEPPARIHGDLWNGNVLWADDGVVLIDPAAHGGHRESDLAMLDLFGCPHLTEIVGAYREMAPLHDGWRERIPVHQMHPLAVHAVGHGPAYGAALADAARRTLALG